MSNTNVRSSNAKKKEVKVALITAAAVVLAATLGIIPALKHDSKKDPASSSQSVSATGSQNIAIGVLGSTGNVFNISPTDNRLTDLVAKGLPETDHPVVDLSQPIESQVRLFPEDKIRIVGLSDKLESVWFGDSWQKFDYGRDYSRQFTVMGQVGQPMIPKFRGTGVVKLEVSYTRYRDKPRDLRAQAPKSGAIDKK